MSKPEDIPQDVWDVADAVGEAIYGRHDRGWVSWPIISESGPPAQDIIARAIMAAKAEERDDRENVALKIAAAYDESANGLPVDSYKVPYRLHRRNAAIEIASAIRKRGEQTP